MSEHRDPRRWWALAVIGLAQLMVVLDATIVNIALPTAQADLDISDGSRHWVITAYALAFGGLLVVGGRVADRSGARRVLLIGLAGFAAASMFAGLAPHGWVLFSGRALQGVFAALIAPAALSLLSTTFVDPRERGTAYGIYGALSGGGAAVGLLAGGFLTEHLTWRWCLYVNVPIAVAALAGGLVSMSVSPRRVSGTIDIPGAFLSCAGLVGIVLGFAQAEARGWSDFLVIGLLVSGVALIALLVRVEGRTTGPLLPLRVLKHRGCGGALLAVGLSQVALFGFFLFITYYMQDILGYSALRTGVAFLPLTVAIGIGSSVLAARLLHRTGARPLITSGLVLAAAGMAALSQLGTNDPNVYLTYLLPAQIAIGLGLGLVMMPAMSTATSDISDSDTGVAGALVNAAQQVGGAMGTALLNTVATAATHAYLTGSAGSGRTEAAVQGYTTAIGAAAAILAATAVICAVVLPRRANADVATPSR